MVKEMIFDKEGNFKERIEFVKYWAKYVRTHDDKDWSRQQAMLINSQLENSRCKKK